MSHSQRPVDSPHTLKIVPAAAAGINGRGNDGETAAVAALRIAAAPGVGGGPTGAGKFRTLIDAHAIISDQQFIVTIKCIYSGMNGDQPPDEAALTAELVDEALADVDDATQLQVVDLLRNLLQKVSVPVIAYAAGFMLPR